jgi:glycosyltransferase involved in cell wall biosynthesis
MSDCVANNSVLEALACGTPVVATDVGDVTDYIDETCAVLSDAGDARGCADALLDLLRSPRQLAQLSAGARARAETFSWLRVVEELRRVYDTAWWVP